jgi:hypothetical protein
MIQKFDISSRSDETLGPLQVNHGVHTIIQAVKDL